MKFINVLYAVVWVGQGGQQITVPALRRVWEFDEDMTDYQIRKCVHHMVEEGLLVKNGNGWVFETENMRSLGRWLVDAPVKPKVGS